MRLRRISAWIIVIVLCLASQAVKAQQNSSNVPDITGQWERARDASIPAPAQPPLKAQYLNRICKSEYQTFVVNLELNFK